MGKRFFFTKIYPFLPYLPWEGPPVPKVLFDGFLAGLFADNSFLAWRKRVEKYKDALGRSGLPNPKASEGKVPRTKIPTVNVPSIETPIEYPVANAVLYLQPEGPISSGFMEALNNRWTIVFRFLISPKAKEAAEGAGLKVESRDIFTDVYFPGGTIEDAEKAKLAFDEFASRYSGVPKYKFPVKAPKYSQ